MRLLPSRAGRGDKFRGLEFAHLTARDNSNEPKTQAECRRYRAARRRRKSACTHWMVLIRETQMSDQTAGASGSQKTRQAPSWGKGEEAVVGVLNLTELPR